MFRIGDIVQVQVSFVAIPVRGNKYKMLAVLRSMALLDGSLSKVRTLRVNVNDVRRINF
jgi:hypothetical protein